MYDLIRKTSTVLPEDVNKAIKKALAQEENGSIAKTTLDIILKSIVLSSRKIDKRCDKKTH
jgi:tartrate dehydratase alpha subunit/fumarate hydratase class I-like protein